MVGTWQLVQVFMLVDIRQLGNCVLWLQGLALHSRVDVGWLSGCGRAGLICNKRLIIVCYLWLINRGVNK